MTLSSSAPEPETTARGRFAKHLRLLRLAAGFTTQGPVAARLGCSADLISKMETGKHVPPQDNFLALLDIYGVSEEARVLLTDLWFLARASSGGIREFFEKYAAAASTSSGETALASAIIALGGPRCGTEVLRAPLLKSAICCWM